MESTFLVINGQDEIEVKPFPPELSKGRELSTLNALLKNATIGQILRLAHGDRIIELTVTGIATNS